MVQAKVPDYDIYNQVATICLALESINEVLAAVMTVIAAGDFKTAKEIEAATRAHVVAMVHTVNQRDMMPAREVLTQYVDEARRAATTTSLGFLSEDRPDAAERAAAAKRGMH
jgi:hypothetical protein